MPRNFPPDELFTVDEFVAAKSTQLVQSDGTMRKLQIAKIAIQFCDWVTHSCGPVVSRRAGAFS
jgi:hypothetical protein